MKIKVEEIFSKLYSLMSGRTFQFGLKLVQLTLSPILDKISLPGRAKVTGSQWVNNLAEIDNNLPIFISEGISGLCNMDGTTVHHKNGCPK